MELLRFEHIKDFEGWRSYISAIGEVSAEKFKFVCLRSEEVEELRRDPDGILRKMESESLAHLGDLALLRVDRPVELVGESSDYQAWWASFFGEIEPERDHVWCLFLNPESVDGGVGMMRFWEKNATSVLEKELVGDLVDVAKNARGLGVWARRLRSQTGGKNGLG